MLSCLGKIIGAKVSNPQSVQPANAQRKWNQCTAYLSHAGGTPALARKGATGQRVMLSIWKLRCCSQLRFEPSGKGWVHTCKLACEKCSREFGRIPTWVASFGLASSTLKRGVEGGFFGGEAFKPRKQCTRLEDAVEVPAICFAGKVFQSTGAWMLASPPMHKGESKWASELCTLTCLTLFEPA